MLNLMGSIFDGIFDSQNAVDVKDFLLCIGVSLAIGALIAFAYAFRNKTTKTFLITLGLMPAIVCAVIMMVNGNIGVGVAVAGTFGLVRFRSANGTAKEITVVFLEMATGLMTGMGYLAYAALFAVIIGGILLLLNVIRFPESKSARAEKTLNITVPEDLDYTDLFTDIFKKYTSEHKLVRVKTTNLGSMFKLTYNVKEKNVAKEKEMLDALRERNGNLEISVCETETDNERL